MCSCTEEDDDDEFGEFECPECGDDLNEENECVNPECPYFEEEVLQLSDWNDRQHERRQMGIGL